MNMIIKQLTDINIGDVGKCDGEFIVDSEMFIYVEKNSIRYQVLDRPPYLKRYDKDDIDYQIYMNNPEKAIFIAYVDGSVAGQVILYKSWNNYAYLHEIIADINFRRQGVGRALMQAAITWAKERHLPGLMLETQTNNLPACRFYESCGFELGGFDNNLYKGINKDSREVALFWYLYFDDSRS